MGERFEDRFKGKTSKMDRHGLASLADRPPAKETLLGPANPPRPDSRTPARMPDRPEGPPAQTRLQPGTEALLGEKQRAGAQGGPGDRKSSSMQKPKQGAAGGSEAPLEAGGRPGPRHDSSNQLGSQAPEQLSHSTSSNRLLEHPWQQPANGSPGKIGGHFQHNAFMVMAPYQLQPQPGSAYPQMLMQPLLPMGYPLPPHGYPLQPMPPPAHTYSAGYAPAYWGAPPAFDDGQKRYGLTEQGSFKVASPQEKAGPAASEPPGKKGFTPYTLEEYKTLSKTQNNKLGGLGANLDGHWEEKVKKNEKVRDYAKMIRGMNSDKIRHSSKARPEKPVSPPKQPSLKDKALQFAKQVPKPKPKKPQEKPQSQAKPQETQQLDEEIGQVEDDLDALERQHQFYQEKINKLKA